MRPAITILALLLLCAAMPAGAAVAAEASAEASALSLSADEAGWISATVAAAPGATVALTDVTEQPEPVATAVAEADGTATVTRAARWTCTSRRRLQARFTDAAGVEHTAEADVATPSCRTRLAVHAPARTRVGHVAALRLSDRWRAGGADVSLCTADPGAPKRCATARLASGRRATRLRIVPRHPGNIRWTVRWPGGHRSGTLAVAPRGRLRVLAAGDSMMQILDDDLRGIVRARAGGTLKADARVSTGITKPFMIDWVAHAAVTSRAVRPDVTVMLLGANDGFGIGDAACCEANWQHRYARRAAAMMRSYARGGRGVVYWLLLPTPRRALYAGVYRAVNASLREAAAQFPGLVRLVDLDAVFTPGGRFRQTMMWRGHRRSVRQADGIHLSVAGAQIAAQVVAARMRADGLLH